MFSKNASTHTFKLMMNRNSIRDHLNMHHVSQLFSSPLSKNPSSLSSLSSSSTNNHHHHSQQPLIRCYATKRRVRDYCVNAMSIDGRFRVALLDNTDSLNEACHRWNSALMSDCKQQQQQKQQKRVSERVEVMGNVMSSSIVLSSFLKGEERIRIELNRRGGVHTCSEAIQVGEVRAYLEQEESEENEENGENGENMENEERTSMFSVQKVMYDMAKPVVSTVQCTDRESVTEILSRFFEVSEQIPTVVQLTTIPDEDPLNLSGKHSLFSGAIIVQELPSKGYDIGVRELQADRTRQRLMEIGEQVARFGKELKSTAAAAQSSLYVNKNNQNNDVSIGDSAHLRAQLHEMLFSKFQVSGEPKQGVDPILCLDKSTVRFTSIDFLCRCSVDQVVRAFSGVLTDEELKEMDETREEVSATCEYCNTVYTINSDMVTEFRSKVNAAMQQQTEEQ